jgi:hypothetical protein
MVAWYPLDEQQGATAVNDIAPPPSSVFNNVGTPQTGPVGFNGPPPVTGLVGAGALYFYSGNYVEVPSQAELDVSDFSIDAWVRPVGCGPGLFSPILDKLDANTNTGFSLYLDQPPPAGTAVLKLQVNASTFTSTGSIPANADPLQNTGPWSHIAVTVQRTGPSPVGTFYINGSPSGTFVPPAGTMTNTLPMWIGEIRVPGARCEIAIDELELFNRALAQQEVQDIYNAGSAGKCKCIEPPAIANMVAWWPLDEPAGAGTVVDIGLPPPNDGTPQPGPISAPAGGPQAVPGNLVTSPPDGALLFPVSTTYVEVPPSGDLNLANSDLTIDAWIMPTEVHPVLPGVVDVVEPIVDKLGSSDKGYAFYVQITGTCLTCPPSPQAPPPGTMQDVEMYLVFAVGDGNSTSFYRSNAIYAGTFTVAAVPPLNPPWPGWMHVAVTVDRSTGNAGTFYLNGSSVLPLPNGSPVGSFAPVAGMDDSTTPLWIGGTRLFPTPIGIQGEIEINELEIFNVPLTEPDILSIAAATAGKCKTPAPTPTGSPNSTPTPTPTVTPAGSATSTRTQTVTPTSAPPNSPTATPTVMVTNTATPTATATYTPTRTATSSPTPTPTCGEPISVIISTGQSASVGSTDPHWQLIAAPPNTTGFSGPAPATVIAPNSGWATLPNTQWISAHTDCSQTITGSCPGGVYSYRLCWEQCGMLAPSPVLQILADNTAQVFLDGSLTPLATSPASIDFTTPATILNVNPGPGTHSLRVDVANDPYSNSACTGSGVPLPCCTGPGTGTCGTATGMDLSGILSGSVEIVPCPRRPCVGDCNDGGQVTIDDILTMVNIALGNTDVGMCSGSDANQDGRITVDEILSAVNNALNGCPASGAY